MRFAITSYLLLLVIEVAFDRLLLRFSLPDGGVDGVVFGTPDAGS